MSTALARSQERVEVVIGSKGQKAICKMTDDGRQLLATRTVVRLDPAKKHVWELAQWTNEDGQLTKTVTRMITAAGYNYLNRYAGIVEVRPRTIPGPANTCVNNPYIERDATGMIEFILITLIGIGRSATGNLQAVEYSLQYDLRTYFTQDVMSKWLGKKRDPVSKTWGKLWAAATIPDDVRLDPRKKLIRMGDDILAIDLDDREVQGLLAEHRNRQRFAERNAQTICWRNILKKMLGEAVLTDDLSVEITCWVTPDGQIQDATNNVHEALRGVSVSRVREVADRPDAPALEGHIVDDDADETTPQLPADDEPGSISPPALPAQSDADRNDEIIALRDEIKGALTRIPGATGVLRDRGVTAARIRESRDVALLREIVADIREMSGGKGGAT